MPTSNMPDPDKIPDMSLDDRTDHPAPVKPLLDTTSFQAPTSPESYSNQPQPAAESSRPRSYEEPEPKVWQEGDDVLAPWEPTMLYPGTIKEIAVDDARGNQALIAFDDGGEGWVQVYSLCPLEFKVGAQVQVRRYNGQSYHAAEVLEVSGGEVRVRYDNGGTEWTRMATLRVPCIANGPPAVMTKLASWQTLPIGEAAAAGGGVPTWVIWIGIAILLAVVRVGCRAAMQN